MISGGLMSPKQNRVKKTDEGLREVVEEKLFKSYSVDSSAIEIQVENGVVTLRGFVPTQEEIVEARRCIENIIGVIEVKNELVVAKLKNKPLSKTGFETGFS